jgi:hypothetical protein
MGEHLVCSPCGKVAGCASKCIVLAGSGGAAVALAWAKKADYTYFANLSLELRRWLEVQAADSSACRRACNSR